ncbi:MAG TPA: YdcF family protein [Desulfitobacterium dehalogenans]|uniref:YdcF family protein n=1 Tax=Desulfitobacterium dehalogenans TaxID=36854 RepID=A0A7C7D6V9_9FIRM|nr:YdcF family protein [Desulfitobacterium dehalogenans]
MGKRSWGSWICIFLGIVGILDTIIVIALKGGVNLGTILPAGLGGLFLLWGLWGNEFKNTLLKERYPWLRKLIRWGIVLLLGSFFMIEGLLLWNTEDTIPEHGEVLIILGAGLNGDQLSWTLWERVNKGVEILEENPQMKVVVSGGQGPGEWVPEAEAMAQYLMGQGIAPERILKETRSTSTMENFRFSRFVLDQVEGFDPAEPVLVITSDFHMFRSKILAGRIGLNPVGVPCPTPWYIRPNAYLREYFAVVKSILFDW